MEVWMPVTCQPSAVVLLLWLCRLVPLLLWL
jgi:hypothetical protein